jgi:hypothetical protein
LPHKKTLTLPNQFQIQLDFARLKKNCWLFPTIKSSTLLDKYDKEKKKDIKKQRYREEDVLNFDFKSKERLIK